MSYAVVHRTSQTYLVQLEQTDDNITEPRNFGMFHHHFNTPIEVPLHSGMGGRTVKVADIVAQSFNEEQLEVIKTLIEAIEHDATKARTLNVVLLFPNVEVVLVGDDGDLTVTVENNEGRRGWRSAVLQSTFILGPMSEVLRHPLNSKITHGVKLEVVLNNLLQNGVFGDGYKGVNVKRL